MSLVNIPSFYTIDKNSAIVDVPLFYHDKDRTFDTTMHLDTIPIPEFYGVVNSQITPATCGTSLCSTAQSCAACMFSCQPGCQWNCEHMCENNCEWDCQSSCQSKCEVGCQEDCQDACQAYCENWCMCHRQSNQGCLDECEDYCMDCEGECMVACESTCEGCLSCEDECEWNCESYCMRYCEDYCESSCETTCEKSCMDACEVNTQDPQPPAPSYLNLTDITKDGVTLTWGLVTGTAFYHINLNDNFITSVRHPANTRRIEIAFAPSTEYTVCVSAVRILTEGKRICKTFTSPASIRPENWTWNNTTSSSGNTLYVMHSALWNEFTSRINAFRAYKQVYTYPFTTVGANHKLTAGIFNEAVHAINEVLPSPIISLLTSDIRVPDDFMSLSTTLNSIK